MNQTINGGVEWFEARIFVRQKVMLSAMFIESLVHNTFLYFGDVT